MNQEPVQTRDVARLVVPRCGQLASTGDLGEPYRLIDAEGAIVEPVAAFLRELLAAGRSPARSMLIGAARRGSKPATSAGGFS